MVCYKLWLIGCCTACGSLQTSDKSAKVLNVPMLIKQTKSAGHLSRMPVGTFISHMLFISKLAMVCNAPTITSAEACLCCGCAETLIFIFSALSCFPIEEDSHNSWIFKEKLKFCGFSWCKHIFVFFK